VEERNLKESNDRGIEQNNERRKKIRERDIGGVLHLIIKETTKGSLRFLSANIAREDVKKNRVENPLFRSAGGRLSRMHRAVGGTWDRGFSESGEGVTGKRECIIRKTKTYH